MLITHTLSSTLYHQYTTNKTFLPIQYLPIHTILAYTYIFLPIHTYSCLYIHILTYIYIHISSKYIIDTKSQLLILLNFQLFLLITNINFNITWMIFFNYLIFFLNVPTFHLIVNFEPII